MANEQKKIMRKANLLPEDASSYRLAILASEAQSAKVKAVLDRIDDIGKLDKQQLEGLSDLMSASVADGGCGIGCW